MLERASLELDIDLGGSFMVGDKITDLQAGRAAGCRVVLVRTGYGREMETQLEDVGVAPDHVADDLQEASQWILQQAS
jgi:D-glycero-D-manno-heptose 1,7-bisphosphate phosphatase